MARETAQQRKARYEAEVAARVEAERVAYPARLMAVLERLNNQYDLDLKVKNGFFLVTNSGKPYDEEYEFAYSYDKVSQASLENLDSFLTQLEEAQAEAKRRDEVRREAKRKAQELFTDEERELLGL